MAKKKTNQTVKKSSAKNSAKSSAKDRSKKLLRALPSVSSLLEHPEVMDWLEALPRSCVVIALQTALTKMREEILIGDGDDPLNMDNLLTLAEEELLDRAMPSMIRVINASGIVLHTGLGRAPLGDIAIDAIAETASGYCNLEYDLSTGSRGKRQGHVAKLLTDLTGAEAATVVNNNAAAVLLTLRTFAEGREVVVSRGQLIEIGGSFRIPDIMRAGGAILREVGTTNRTRIADFDKAIGDNTAVLLRAHPSNYRVVGFTEETPLSEMVELARRHQLITLDDLGSGSLLDLSQFGLPSEPTVQDSLQAGVDLVCFSGDKLLGGPQCGIIAGRSDLIDQLNAHPLMRTYRVGKLTLAALDATLRAYLDPAEAIHHIPTLAMLSASTEQLGQRAQILVDRLTAALPDEQFLVCSDVAYAGGGSMPAREIPTVVVQWRPQEASVTEIAAALRDGEMPVIVRIRDDAVCFDLRTLADEDFDILVEAVTEAVWDENEESETEGMSLPVI